MPKQDQMIVGLDIGTSKIACVVAEVSMDGRLDVIGIGTHASRGLRKGVVVDIESTVESIRLAVEEAELMAGVEIKKVHVGIAGSHIRGHNTTGIIATRHGEVTAEDVQRVIENGSAMKLPDDRTFLHVMPQEYSIDDQDGIREPIGMSGVRLQAKIHLVTAAISSAHNIRKCCKRCGLEVSELVLEQVASSCAVLLQDEKDIGVVLVDIGGGTTDIAVFLDGAIQYTSVIPIGGDHLTNDLVVGLRTSAREADELKRKHGSCMLSDVGEHEEVQVPSVGGRDPRPMPRHIMAQILQPRVEELFDLITEELQCSGYHELVAAGIVLTGGCSLLSGMETLAEETFDMPVRIGTPQNVGGLADVVNSPAYATAVGLIQYSTDHHPVANRVRQRDPVVSSQPLWQRMRNWFGDAS
ncbi:MAG: cell division protein FtsA [Mariprofundaceae bacterium]|nr:cell division protein FtsA [Mariprofundaceae bacterium]